MLDPGFLWLLLADGRRARILSEERRGALLQEVTRLQIEAADRIASRDRAARAFDSVGAGRHAMDGGRNLHEAEEAVFLRRVADEIAAAEARESFAHFVIIAPPRALGLLRAAWPERVLARLRADLAKDLLDEADTALRERLRELLRR